MEEKKLRETQEPKRDIKKFFRVFGYVLTLITSAILGVSILGKGTIFGLDLKWLEVFYKQSRSYLFIIVFFFGMLLVIINQKKTNLLNQLVGIIAILGSLTLEFYYQGQGASLFLGNLAYHLPTGINDLISKIPYPSIITQEGKIVFVVLVIALIVTGQTMKEKKVFSLSSILVGFGVVFLGISILSKGLMFAFPDVNFFVSKTYLSVQGWLYFGSYGLIAVGSAFGCLGIFF